MTVFGIIRFEFLVFFILSPASIRSTTDLIHTAANSTSTEPYPIDLYDLGFDSTWEKFCDDEEIEKLYPEFLEHDLTRMRTTICISKKSGQKPDDKQLKTIAFYKYCTAVKPIFDDFLMKLADKLSLGDQDKRFFLFDSDNRVNQTACYDKTMNAFYKTCAGEQNPCLTMFKMIFARGCEAPWLTTEDIFSYINEICTGKWVTDDIDWEALLQSIKYYN